MANNSKIIENTGAVGAVRSADKQARSASKASGKPASNKASDKAPAKASAKAAAAKAQQKSGKPSRDSKKAPKKDNIFKRAMTYFHNVRLEIKRTTWPTRSEVANMTIIVVVALLFFGILIFILDQIMVTLLGLYGQIPNVSETAAAADAAAAAADTAAAANAASGDTAGEAGVSLSGLARLVLMGGRAL
jgi:preprotein translocase subunit SecE